MDLLRRLVGPDGLPSGRVTLFVGGPNVFHDEFDMDLDDIRTAGRSLGGQLNTARLRLSEHATSGLIQAAEAHGFEVVVTNSGVDVKLTVDFTRYAIEDRADVIAVALRDTDFKPALETANAYGLRTVTIAPRSYGHSSALQSATTHMMTLGESATDDN